MFILARKQIFFLKISLSNFINESYFQAHSYLLGVQKKSIFFLIHCNPFLAFISLQKRNERTGHVGYIHTYRLDRYIAQNIMGQIDRVKDKYICFRMFRRNFGFSTNFAPLSHHDWAGIGRQEVGKTNMTVSLIYRSIYLPIHLCIYPTTNDNQSLYISRGATG